MSAICIFDSGVGGVSIAQSVHQRLPRWPILYSSDNQNYPYGTKSEAEVVANTLGHVKKLADRYEIELLVIACNTASTVALPRVREHLQIPVVGVVPAIKPAAAQSVVKKIGLLATPGTVDRPYTDALIKQFASDCDVVKVGTRELVDMAEAKLRGEPIDAAALSAILRPFWEAEVDTVVLGCTHFPLLLSDLRAINDTVNWIDSGDAIAARCASLLAEKTPGESYLARAVFSSHEGVDQLIAGLHQFGIATVEFI